MAIRNAAALPVGVSDAKPIIRPPTLAPGAEIVTHTSLRGVAALSVVLFHVSARFQPDDFGIVGDYVRHSYLFVDLFFILSGFILTMKYAAWFEEAIAPADVRRFMATRLARVYPNYLLWLILAVCTKLALAAVLGKSAFPPDVPGAEVVRSFVLHVLMLHGLLRVSLLFDIPLWSIATECFAYLVFPFLIVGVAARPRAALAVLAVGALAGLGLAEARHGSLNLSSGPGSFLRCLAGFSIGVVVAHVSPERMLPRGRTLSFAQVVVALGAAAAVGAGADVLAVMLFSVLVFVTQENDGILFRALRRRPVFLLGVYSFSIYLAHPIVEWIATPVTLGAAAMAGVTRTVPLFLLLALLTAGASIVVAAAAYHVFERPAAHFLRRRFL